MIIYSKSFYLYPPHLLTTCVPPRLFTDTLWIGRDKSRERDIERQIEVHIERDRERHRKRNRQTKRDRQKKYSDRKRER